MTSIIASTMNKSLKRNGTHLTAAIDFCADLSVTPSTLSYSIGMVVILLIAVIGNALVLVAVTMSPNLRKRVTTLFIISLACSDIAFAVSLIPFKVSMSLHNDMFCHKLPACYFYVMSDVIVNVTSMLNLFLIALDRFVAIKWPFQYQELLSPFRAKFLVGLVWSFAIIWSVLGLFSWDRDQTNGEIISISLLSTDQYGNPGPPRCIPNNKLYFVVSAISFTIVPLANMTLMYICILHVALSQIRAIEATQVPIGHLVPASNSEYPSPTSGRPRRGRNRQGKRKKELRATKSVAIVYGAYVVCFLPSIIITFIIFSDPDFFVRLYQKNQSLFLFTYYTFIEVLPVMNSGLNPFIYSFSNKQFRNAFKRVLCKIMGNALSPELPIDSTHVPTPRVSTEQPPFGMRSMKSCVTNTSLLSRPSLGQNESPCRNFLPVISDAQSNASPCSMSRNLLSQGSDSPELSSPGSTSPLTSPRKQCTPTSECSAETPKMNGHATAHKTSSGSPGHDSGYLNATCGSDEIECRQNGSPSIVSLADVENVSFV